MAALFLSNIIWQIRLTIISAAVLVTPNTLAISYKETIQRFYHAIYFFRFIYLIFLFRSCIRSVILLFLSSTNLTPIMEEKNDSNNNTADRVI